jgi:hypothetical protein
MLKSSFKSKKRVRTTRRASAGGSKIARKRHISQIKSASNFSASSYSSVGKVEIYEKISKISKAFVKGARGLNFSQVIESVSQEYMRTNRHEPNTQFHAALLRGVQSKQEIMAFQGGAISAQDAAPLLRLSSKQAVLDRFHKNQLLGWREKQDAIKFPLWQFNRSGGVWDGLEDCLHILSKNTLLDEWAKLLFFITPRSSLGNKLPLDLLKEGETEKAILLASQYAE